MSCFVQLFCGALFAANEQDVIASVEYFYAQDGTLIGRAVNGIRQNFEYDKRGQLLAVKDANGRDLERYTYDPAGNRLSKTVNGVTTTYTYDEANQLKTSTVNGKTTNYRYDAAGRLVQAGDKTYYYFGANDKVTEVRQGDKVIAEFDYFMDGQIASAKYPDREENFTWDGLALVQRNEVSYINEPYVTGGNPILSSRNGVIFNDMLGSTLNIGGQLVFMSSFGESADDSAFFTGKPMISELGYSFLFRDYNPSQGKWTSSDPLGYPDGWNNFAYCNNTTGIDCLGLLVTATFSITREKLEVKEYLEGTSHFAHAFSGNSIVADQWEVDIGPLPIGTYAIIEHPDKTEWWMLWYSDGTWDDFAIGPNDIVRDKFRLHAGRSSRGCITMDKPAEADVIIELLQSTTTTLLRDADGNLKKYYGVLTVVE